MAEVLELTEQSARHAVYIQRFAGGLDNKFLPFLEQLKNSVNSRVARTEFQLARQESLLLELSAIQASVYAEYMNQLQLDLNEFAVSESEWQERSLKTVVNVDTTVPAAGQVIAAATATPMVFPDSNVAKQMDSFIKDWSASEIRRVNGIISTGFITGQTQQEIVRSVDQVFDKAVRRNNEAVVRTAVNHMSSVAREQTYKDNDHIVIGYRWISTLDSRTTSPCRSLDQQVFKLDDSYQPRPPFHPNCRSTTVPELDGRFTIDDAGGERPSIGDEGRKVVGAKTSYYEFLKQQKPAFQNEAIGPARGRLLRNGGLTAEEFADLAVDDKFRPLTLEQMAAKNPEAFENAGIEL